MTIQDNIPGDNQDRNPTEAARLELEHLIGDEMSDQLLISLLNPDALDDPEGQQIGEVIPPVIDKTYKLLEDEKQIELDKQIADLKALPESERPQSLVYRDTPNPLTSLVTLPHGAKIGRTIEDPVIRITVDGWDEQGNHMSSVSERIPDSAEGTLGWNQYWVDDAGIRQEYDNPALTRSEGLAVLLSRLGQIEATSET